MTVTSTQDQIAAVVRRLAAGDDLSTEAIEAIEVAVREQFDGWGEARVRDFVPIFVERELRARLPRAT